MTSNNFMRSRRHLLRMNSMTGELEQDHSPDDKRDFTEKINRVPIIVKARTDKPFRASEKIEDLNEKP